jgi:hypothetical protein
MTRRQVRALALGHQRARIAAAMPLANRAREAYAKAVRDTSGLSYAERTTPPLFRGHERVINAFIASAAFICLVVFLVSCFRG